MFFSQDVITQPAMFSAPSLKVVAWGSGLALLLIVIGFLTESYLAVMGGWTFAFIFGLVTLGLGMDGARGYVVPAPEIAEAYDVPVADLPEVVKPADSPFILPDGRELMRSDQRETNTVPGIETVPGLWW